MSTGYLLTTIFGGYHNWSFLQEDRFSELLNVVEEIGSWYRKPLTLRCWVSGPKGKNVGTGGRKYEATKVRHQLREYLANGSFGFLELLERDAKQRDPDLFFQVMKHQGWEGGPTPTPDYGPSVSVTLAVHQSQLASADDTRYWLNTARRLFTLLEGVVGTTDGDRPWGIPLGWAPGVTDLIDSRWKDIPDGEYRWGYGDGHIDMATRLVRPTWGYFLGPGHVKALGGMEAVLGLPGMVIKEPLGESRAFVALTETPHALTEAEELRVREILRPIMA